MTRSAILLPALAWAVIAAGQGATVAEKRSYAFSDGIHPTFAVTHQDANLRVVEDHWRGVLKGVSHKVGGRKEIVGMTALIPEISPDTMRVLVKGEQPRGSTSVTLHVAFFTTEGYVGPGSDSLMVRGAREFVQRHALALRIQLADQAVRDAERALARQRRDLAMLEREQGRMEMQRTKAQLRDSSAVADQQRLTDEMSAAQARVDDQQAVLRDAHDEADVKELKSRTKEREKLQSRFDAAVRKMEKARRRDTSLKESLRRNAEAQGARQADIERESARVEELRTVRQAIH